MDATIAQCGKLITSVQPLLAALKKYESSFSPEAKQLLQGTLQNVESLKTQLEGWSPGLSGISGYLVSGKLLGGLKDGLPGLQQSLSSMLGGVMPLPRSSKEDLTNIRTQLMVMKIDVPAEQTQLVAQLEKLYGAATDQQHDVDVIETTLDGAVRQVLQNVYGATTLSEQDLQNELTALGEAAKASKAAGHAAESGMLSLTLNSLQRLHASQLKVEESEEEEEEEEEAMDEDDDEDDPFYMPMMPAAIKMAEASKFSLLAEPLGPAQAKPFMIKLEPTHNPDGVMPSPGKSSSQVPVVVDGAVSPGAEASSTSAATRISADGGTAAASTADSSRGETAATGVAGAAAAETIHEEEEAGPGLTAQDFEPVPMDAQMHPAVRQELAVDAATDGVSGLPSPGAQATTPGSEGAAGSLPKRLSSNLSGAAAAAATAAAGGAAAGAAAGQGGLSTRNSASQQAAPEGGEQPALQAVAADGSVIQPSEEKLSQFVNFLQGDNPGACMFHAQMRLSVEGCRKLSNFLKSSARVRALSLSHNYLGDDGLAIICEGLAQNTSVTALDLPDNNISDVGVSTLMKAIAHNPSLTQLQLAYNRIGDAGAVELAECIKTSDSLKKLGLSYNNIGKAGCQALTAAISSNQSLKHLQLLPGNPVEEKDAKALAKALKRNKKFSIRAFLGIEGGSGSPKKA